MKKVLWIAMPIFLLCCVGFYILIGHTNRVERVRHQNKQVNQVSQNQQAREPVPQLLTQEESFDEPLHRTIVDPGVSPNVVSQAEHSELRCYYFKGFAVKELDLKEQGDEWVSISPHEGANLPPCVKEHGRGEIAIQAQDWSGTLTAQREALSFSMATMGTTGGILWSLRFRHWEEALRELQRVGA